MRRRTGVAGPADRSASLAIQIGQPAAGPAAAESPPGFGSGDPQDGHPLRRASAASGRAAAGFRRAAPAASRYRDRRGRPHRWSGLNPTAEPSLWCRPGQRRELAPLWINVQRAPRGTACRRHLHSATAAAPAWRLLARERARGRDAVHLVSDCVGCGLNRAKRRSARTPRRPSVRGTTSPGWRSMGAG